MDLSTRSVLVDGSLSSPAVWLSIALSTLFLVIAGTLFVRLLLPPRRPVVLRRLFWLPLAPALLVTLPFANHIAFGLVFLGSLTSFELCLMPTLHPVRDFLPLVLALAPSVVYARRRSLALVAA